MLPSGAIRVRVYAGLDPLSGERHYLTDVIPDGPGAWDKAEAVRAEFVRDVAERRNTRTNATVDELLTRYLDQFSGAPGTLENHRSHVRNHIGPCLGHLRVGRLNAETLDTFYAQLRRCRLRCTNRRMIDHRVRGPHECNDRCRPHQCQPLSASTIRQIHFLLSGAYRKAVRWGWVAESPTAQADAPAMSRPNPEPPTVEQAARIVMESWSDADWGTMVWLAMTTGARRGELSAVRRTSLDLVESRETLWLRRAIRRDGHGGWEESDLKTHQQRRIALDVETATVLREHISRCARRAAALGVVWPDDALLFSTKPDGSTFPTPPSLTQRYDRMVARLGIPTTLHKLRHYSATELIAAGVDPRTVAGRLGHGGGGTTTLKTYTAWVSEADQRAATGLGTRMPQRPVGVDAESRRRASPRHPYERVAVAVSGMIADGHLAGGDVAPRPDELAVTHDVSLATAKRALALLVEWGELTRAGRGPLMVTSLGPEVEAPDPVPQQAAAPAYPENVGELCRVVLRRAGVEVRQFATVLDISSADDLQETLEDAVSRIDGDLTRIREYELDVAAAKGRQPALTYVAPRRAPVRRVEPA